MTLIVAAGLVAATIGLGRWQLGRAHTKEALAAQIAARMHMPALEQGPQALDLASNVWRPVVARGTYATAWNVYLQNRQYAGKAGFWVLTPLRLQGSDTYVMVLRGWAAPDPHAAQLIPAVPTPAGVTEVSGRLAPAPSQWFSFAKDPPGAVVRQNISLDEFSSFHHIRMLPYVIELIGHGADGLVRDWPKPDAGMQTNYGYAFQWFAMSTVGVGLMLYFLARALHRRRQAGRRG